MLSFLSHVDPQLLAYTVMCITSHALTVSSSVPLVNWLPSIGSSMLPRRSKVSLYCEVDSWCTGHHPLNLIESISPVLQSSLRSQCSRYDVYICMLCHFIIWGKCKQKPHFSVCYSISISMQLLCISFNDFQMIL